MAEASKATQRCGDCVRFKVPDAGCPNYESFTEYVDGRPLMDAHCAACSDFHEVRKARDKKTKKLERLTPDFQDRCVVCGLQGRMDWQITRHDDSWGLLCGSCGEKVEKRLRDSV